MRNFIFLVQKYKDAYIFYKDSYYFAYDLINLINIKNI